MMRIVSLVSFAVLMASPITGFAPPAAEDFAVYSAVLGDIPRDAQGDRRLLIARGTLVFPELPLPSIACLRLSPEFTRRVEALLTLNRDARQGPEVLEGGKFSMDRSYVLLDSRQADQWRRRRFQPQVATDPPDKESADPFPEANLFQLRAFFSMPISPWQWYMYRKYVELCAACRGGESSRSKKGRGILCRRRIAASSIDVLLMA